MFEHALAVLDFAAAQTPVAGAVEPGRMALEAPPAFPHEPEA